MIYIYICISNDFDIYIMIIYIYIDFVYVLMGIKYEQDMKMLSAENGDAKQQWTYQWGYSAKNLGHDATGVATDKA